MILWHAGLTMLIMWFVVRGNPRVDYRIVAVASLLPDLIDKPIGRLLLRDRYESGRIYAHTLLLNLALFCVLFFMRGRAKRTLVLIPISSLLHLAEDGVWSHPRVFWWPLFGTAFPRDPVSDGTLSFLNPLNNPGAIWQETVGLAVIVWLLASHGLLNREGIRSFIRTGRLTAPEEVAR
jgi:inner membrane protein